MIMPNVDECVGKEHFHKQLVDMKSIKPLFRVINKYQNS